MADPHTFSEDGARRIVRAVRQSEAHHGARAQLDATDPWPASTDETWCEVITVAANYVTCRPLDATVAEAASRDFKVAKPLHIQKVYTEGATIRVKDDDAATYTVAHNASASLQKRVLTKVSDSSTEDQYIVPRYVSRSGSMPGDYILVKRPACGTRTVDEDDEPIGWIDTTARLWAKG